MAKGKDLRKEKIIRKIELPEGVTASLEGQVLLIKGPKGDVKKSLKQHSVSIRIENRNVILETEKGSKTDKKITGALTAHVKNMINGSLQSHSYTLKVCAGHFPVTISVSANKLTVKNFLGEKVPRVLQLKEGANVKVEGDIIHVTSADKEIAGQVSADIEQLTRRPGYDTRIFQDGIYIINKDGKDQK